MVAPEAYDARMSFRPDVTFARAGHSKPRSAPVTTSEVLPASAEHSELAAKRRDPDVD